MISPSKIVYADGREKRVKNLGWLLRNWRRVREIRLYTKDLTNPSDDGYLVADVGEGNRYMTGFADSGIMKQFVVRPVFRGLPLIVDGEHVDN